VTVNELIDKFADAIAYAEGYYVTSSRAERNHNPGNLTVDTTGTSIGNDGPFMVYASPDDGWEALKKQVERMIDGTSQYYNQTMSILEIAYKYTATDALAWARNVASRLGVSTDITLMDLLSEKSLMSGGIILAILAIIFLFRKG